MFARKIAVPVRIGWEDRSRVHRIVLHKCNLRELAGDLVIPSKARDLGPWLRNAKTCRYSRVNFSISFRCCGNSRAKSSLVASSKSSNSNPGATVQPTSAHDL